MTDRLAILGGSPTLRPEDFAVWPDIRQEDRDAVNAVLDSGVLTGGGSVAAPGLAEDYARYCGVRYCLPFNAGTAALHACLVTLGVGPGDEVIVPAFTYVASAMVVLHAGATPVFVDVQPGTFNLDPARIEERITERTKAIIAVHLHGMPCDLEEILAVARKHDLKVVEDSSQAHGARYRGQRVSSFGACAGASLNATKNLPGGEGGLFVTDDEELLTAADRLRYMGEDLPPNDRPAGRRYWSHGIGYNYRAQELPSALARSQLKRLDEYNNAAEANAKRLTAALAGTAGIITPAIPEDRNSVWYLYRVGLDAAALGTGLDATEVRDRFVAALAAEGLPVMLWQHHPIPAHSTFRRTPPAPWHPALRDDDLAPFDAGEYPVSQSVCDTTLIIGNGGTPLSVQSEATIDAIAAGVQKVAAAAGEIMSMPFEVPDSTRLAADFVRSRGREGLPPSPDGRTPVA